MSPALALLETAINDPLALGRALGKVAKSGELTMAARRYKASCVSAAGTIVRLPTAGR